MKSEIVITDVPTGIFGVGATLQEAVADFQTALREHQDVLSRRPSLSDDLQAQLAYLNRHLKADGPA